MKSEIMAPKFREALDRVQSELGLDTRTIGAIGLAAAATVGSWAVFRFTGVEEVFVNTNSIACRDLPMSRQVIESVLGYCGVIDP